MQESKAATAKVRARVLRSPMLKDPTRSTFPEAASQRRDLQSTSARREPRERLVQKRTGANINIWAVILVLARRVISQEHHSSRPLRRNWLVLRTQTTSTQARMATPSSRLRRR